MLDANGRPPADAKNLGAYLDCFSVHDVYQGHIANCHIISAFLCIARNRDLLAHLMPIDNAAEVNIKKDAYHFRLWSLGEWHDVVVDGMLPTKNSSDLLFSRNTSHFNEYWTPLLEKALAK